jgi:hypothetical protein
MVAKDIVANVLFANLEGQAYAKLRSMGVRSP